MKIGNTMVLLKADMREIEAKIHCNTPGDVDTEALVDTIPVLANREEGCDSWRHS